MAKYKVISKDQRYHNATDLKYFNVGDVVEVDDIYDTDNDGEVRAYGKHRVHGEWATYYILPSALEPVDTTEPKQYVYLVNGRAYLDAHAAIEYAIVNGLTIEPKEVSK